MKPILLGAIAGIMLGLFFACEVGAYGVDYQPWWEQPIWQGGPGDFGPGGGLDPRQSRGIPEPTTRALLPAALVLLYLASRKRKGD